MSLRNQKVNKTGNSNSKIAIKKSLPDGWLALGCFLLAFFVYSNTLRFQYACDDSSYTYSNSHVQKGISSFFSIITKGSREGSTGGYINDYRPATILSFAIEKSLFGNSPATNHFFNVLLYALLCALLFIFLRKILVAHPDYVPLLITALFVLHPLHTEVVANIKSRDELLCMFFGILSLYFIFLYFNHPKKNTRYFVLSCFAFLLTVLSKESGFVYVAVIPLVLFFFTGASLKRIAVVSIPFITIAGVTYLMRMHALSGQLFDKQITILDNSLLVAINPIERLATTSTILFHSLSLLFFPLTLSWDYSYNQFPVVSWNNLKAIISLCIYLALLLISVYGLKKKNIFSFAILFYFITSFLTSNIIIQIASTFGERFLFAPSLAFCIALPFLLALILKIDFKKTPVSGAGKIIGILIIIFILYVFKTIDRSKVWKDNTTLYASGVLTSPQSARAHFLYADDLRVKVESNVGGINRNETAKLAISEFQKGLDIYEDTNSYVMYYNIGVLYYSLGDTAQAMTMYKKALNIKPDYADALNNCGVILFNKKDYTNAAACFVKASESQPGYVKAFVNAAGCFQLLNNSNKAIEYYEKSLKLKPDDANVLSNLSSLYADLHDTAKANYYKALAEKY